MNDFERAPFLAAAYENCAVTNSWQSKSNMLISSSKCLEAIGCGGLHITGKRMLQFVCPAVFMLIDDAVGKPVYMLWLPPSILPVPDLKLI